MKDNRIYEDALKILIEQVEYFNNGKTTVAILRLKNGFEVVGTSAPVDKSSFEEATGKKYAYEVAFNKLWELEGYRLQWKLHLEQNAPNP